MRKLLWILASSLLWCNVGFAEIIFSKCNGLSPNYTYSDTWTINLERGIIREKNSNGSVAYWKINRNYDDEIISYELADLDSLIPEETRLLVEYTSPKLVFSLKDETIKLTLRLNPKAPKEFKDIFKEMIQQGEIKEQVDSSCTVKNLYTKTNKDVLTFNCKLEKWNNWWGTDDEPQEGQFPQQTITFTADLNSKVIRWGSLETTLNVSDNSIEFYRYMKDPEDKKEVEFRYVVDRTNMQFQMIATKNKKKEGVSAIGKCTMAGEKKF